jgi:hypothetical protein
MILSSCYGDGSCACYPNSLPIFSSISDSRAGASFKFVGKIISGLS